MTTVVRTRRSVSVTSGADLSAVAAFDSSVAQARTMNKCAEACTGDCPGCPIQKMSKELHGKPLSPEEIMARAKDALLHDGLPGDREIDTKGLKIVPKALNEKESNKLDLKPKDLQADLLQKPKDILPPIVNKIELPQAIKSVIELRPVDSIKVDMSPKVDRTIAVTQPIIKVDQDLTVRALNDIAARKVSVVESTPVVQREQTATIVVQKIETPQQQPAATVTSQLVTRQEAVTAQPVTTQSVSTQAAPVLTTLSSPPTKTADPVREPDKKVEAGLSVEQQLEKLKLEKAALESALKHERTVFLETLREKKEAVSFTEKREAAPSMWRTEQERATAAAERVIRHEATVRNVEAQSVRHERSETRASSLDAISSRVSATVEATMRPLATAISQAITTELRAAIQQAVQVEVRRALSEPMSASSVVNNAAYNTAPRSYSTSAPSYSSSPVSNPFQFQPTSNVQASQQSQRNYTSTEVRIQHQVQRGGSDGVSQEMLLNKKAAFIEVRTIARELLVQRTAERGVVSTASEQKRETKPSSSSGIEISPERSRNLEIQLRKALSELGVVFGKEFDDSRRGRRMTRSERIIDRLQEILASEIQEQKLSQYALEEIADVLADIGEAGRSSRKAKQALLHRKRSDRETITTNKKTGKVFDEIAERQAKERKANGIGGALEILSAAKAASVGKGAGKKIEAAKTTPSASLDIVMSKENDGDPMEDETDLVAELTYQ